MNAPGEIVAGETSYCWCRGGLALESRYNNESICEPSLLGGDVHDGAGARLTAREDLWTAPCSLQDLRACPNKESMLSSRNDK